ncbi:MAG: Glu/Leu/Phe/Val dehydrogenase [Alphaproteobacteria bacterium]|jgi:glutamate dehydrogenase (NADP+)|nr:Glu/Leu/Phe/Val dehydrogenase [Alphaproteobacteria bacterium]
MSENIFQDTVNLLNKLGKESGINPNVLNYLSQPELLTSVSFPVKMDDGKIRIFKGFRSRYSTILGPAKGGIRFHQDVNAKEVNSLGLWMMVKNSLVGLAYGGGKGGVIVDSRALSTGELERVSRAYVRAIYDAIGEKTDIPAPDVGTNPTVMACMSDEYDTINRVKSPGTFTGKPIPLGGSLFRTEATGFGAYITTKLLSEKIGKSPKETTVAVQGLGNVGYYLTKFLNEEGYKVLAISDVDGAIYCENGLNIPAIYEALAKAKKGTSIATSEIYSMSSGAKVISNAELLELNVDILLPAAIENVITTKNVDKIKAKYIVEVANGPLQPEVNPILEQKGIVILPDVLVNAGGVVVSYFEWLQNLSCYYWDEAEVKEKLIKIMTKAFNNVWELKNKNNVSCRSAAYAIALKRIENALNAKFNDFK